MKKLFVFKIIIISSFFLSSIFSENIYDKFEYPRDDPEYDDSDRPDNKKNFEFCKNEAPLTEYIYYIYEMEHDFSTWVNKDNAHYLVEMAKYWNCYKTNQNSKERARCKNKYNESYYKYLERLGPYFFFVAFAGVVFFTWILLWYCMLYPKCCCKESSNEKNFKYFSFIMVLICLAGMFACIISSFVYSHRWNNRLNGITCAIERLYYNMYYGQKNYRKGTWRGFNGLYYFLDPKPPNKINKKNHKIITKKKENSFNENKKKFRLLEETKNLISKNKSDFSNFFIEKNFINNYTDDKKNTSFSNDSKLKSISLNDSKNNISIFLSNSDKDSSFNKITNFEKNDEYSFINIEEEENEGANAYELDIDKVLKLANAFLKLKPKLFNSYHKVKRALKGLGYYGYFAIYSVLFVIVILLVLPHIFFAFCPNTMCKRYNSLLLIIGWNCIMLFTLYSFFLTAFLGMVDYASIDMIGFFNTYFMKENLKYEDYKQDYFFLIPDPLIGQIFYFCLYEDINESMLNYKFNFPKENIQNSENYNYYKDINNINKDINFNINMNKKDNNKDFNINEQLLNKKHKNIRNLGAILDPDWESDLPLFENTKCSYLKNDINMLYTSFYSFSHMDKKLVAITASISYLGYICAIFMVFTLKKFESHWTKKGKYNYGNDNDDDNSSSDDSSVNNIKKNNNKKIKNNIKIDENLKKNLIDTNIIHKKKKSFDNNNISNNEEENEEDEE